MKTNQITGEGYKFTNLNDSDQHKQSTRVKKPFRPHRVKHKLTLRSRRKSPSVTGSHGWERFHRICLSAFPQPGCAWCRPRTRYTRHGGVSPHLLPVRRTWRCNEQKLSSRKETPDRTISLTTAFITLRGAAASIHDSTSCRAVTYSSASFFMPSHSLIFFCLVPFCINHLKNQRTTELMLTYRLLPVHNIKVLTTVYRTNIWMCKVQFHAWIKVYWH